MFSGDPKTLLFNFNFSSNEDGASIAVKINFDVKRKKYIKKTVIECVKESNILIGLKKTCLGVLDRGNHDKDNETGLKEEGGIEISTTVLPLRDARSFA